MQPTAVPVMPGERALRGGSRYEVKVDGWRARAVIRPGGRAELRSRRGTSLDGRFPELAIALAGLPLGMVLDGEIVAAHPDGSLDFLALQRSRQARAAAGLTDLYIAFDVLAGPGGADLRQRPLRERVAVLDQVLDPHVGSRVQKIASTTDHAVALEWMAALPPGFEGCVVKAKASRYDPRDHRAWVKVRVSAVCGYSSLSIMFLDRFSSMSWCTCGSPQVVQKVARFWAALPSRSSSSWMSWCTVKGSDWLSGITRLGSGDALNGVA